MRRMFKVMSRRTKIVLMGLFLAWLFLAPAVISRYQLVEGEIHYQLTWDTEGIAQFEDGSWQVVNDLGITVTVETGYVASYSVQLLACEHEHGLFQGILGFLTMPTVSAGHGDDDVNPSELVQPIVESLTDLSPIDWGQVTVNEPSYCEGHTIFVKAPNNALNLPAHMDFVEQTLYIEGSYQLPNGEVQPFVAETNLNNGVLEAIISASDVTQAVNVPIGAEVASIQIRRGLGNSFDGIDFVDMDSKALGRMVLWNLVDRVEILYSGE